MLGKPKKRFSINRKGFTLLEVIIAAGISTLIMVGVMSILYLSSTTIRDIYGPAKARSVRSNALNQIHFRLCDAQIGSCEVSDNYHRIRFVDPNLETGGNRITSEFYFDKDQRTLFYRKDIDNSEPMEVSQGPIDITFHKGSKLLDENNQSAYMGADSVVTVSVKTAEEISYADVDTRDGEIVVYLRNYVNTNE